MSADSVRKNAQKKYTIDEISVLTGFSRRTIRYYVQKKIIDPPSGRGRGGFYYDSHVSDLIRLRQLRAQKVKLSSIKNILKGYIDSDKKSSKDIARDLRVRYEVVPGLEINISRDLEEKKNRKIVETIRLIRSIF